MIFLRPKKIILMMYNYLNLKITPLRFFFFPVRTFKTEKELIDKIKALKTLRDNYRERLYTYEDEMSWGILYDQKQAFKENVKKAAVNQEIQDISDLKDLYDKRKIEREKSKTEMKFLNKEILKADNKIKSLCFKFRFRLFREVNKNQVIQKTQLPWEKILEKKVQITPFTPAEIAMLKGQSNFGEKRNWVILGENNLTIIF